MTGDAVALVVQDISIAIVALTYLGLRYRGQQRNADRNAAKAAAKEHPNG